MIPNFWVKRISRGMKLTVRLIPARLDQGQQLLLLGLTDVQILDTLYHRLIAVHKPQKLDNGPVHCRHAKSNAIWNRIFHSHRQLAQLA